MCSPEIKYKKGWLAKRVREAANEFNSYPEHVKKALRLNTGGANV